MGWVENGGGEDVNVEFGFSGLRYPKVGNGGGLGLTPQQHHKLEQMSNPQLPDLLNGEWWLGRGWTDGESDIIGVHLVMSMKVTEGICIVWEEGIFWGFLLSA